MTLFERARAFFPVTREVAYLNHAGVAPISTRVEEAITRFTAEATRYGSLRYNRAYDDEIERVRGRVASLLNAGSDEIAFVKNTTEGLGIVAAGIDWRRGEKVVTCDLEYPSNVYPWWNLKKLGVETVMLHGRDGRLPLASVEEALRNPSVRLLALSSVEFASGARNDLPALGNLCRERGVLFSVDAIQSLGCFPIDVEECGIDFLSADGHKWLLSVEGCGVFYCSRRSIDLLTPRVIGWRSVTENWKDDEYHLDLQVGAGRFEEGTPNTPGIFGLGAAVDLLLEIGVENVAERVLSLTGRLVDGLRERGARVASPRANGEASGIVAFEIPEEEPSRTVARLRERGVFVVHRRGCVRASPHFYNNENEIDQLIAAL